MTHPTEALEDRGYGNVLDEDTWWTNGKGNGQTQIISLMYLAVNPSTTRTRMSKAVNTHSRKHYPIRLKIP